MILCPGCGEVLACSFGGLFSFDADLDFASICHHSLTQLEPVFISKAMSLRVDA